MPTDESENAADSDAVYEMRLTFGLETEREREEERLASCDYKASSFMTLEVVQLHCRRFRVERGRRRVPVIRVATSRCRL